MMIFLIRIPVTGAGAVPVDPDSELCPGCLVKTGIAGAGFGVGDERFEDTGVEDGMGVPVAGDLGIEGGGVGTDAGFGTGGLVGCDETGMVVGVEVGGIFAFSGGGGVVSHSRM